MTAACCGEESSGLGKLTMPVEVFGHREYYRVTTSAVSNTWIKMFRNVNHTIKKKQLYILFIL